MISSDSVCVAGSASAVASGKRRLISVSRRKLVDTMKNRTRTSKTSTREMTFISGSSLERLCSFIGYSKDTGTLLLQHQVDEANRLFLDLHHEAVDAPAQIAVRNERRDRNDETRRRRD